MARARAEKTGMIDRFRYAPGDHHVYVWHAGDTVITVYRIIILINGTDLRATGDTVPVDETDATASAMAARVDQWRAAR